MKLSTHDQQPVCRYLNNMQLDSQSEGLCALGHKQGGGTKGPGKITLE